MYKVKVIYFFLDGVSNEPSQIFTKICSNLDEARKAFVKAVKVIDPIAKNYQFVDISLYTPSDIVIRMQTYEKGLVTVNREI